MLLVMVTGVERAKASDVTVEAYLQRPAAAGAGGKRGRSFPTRWKLIRTLPKKHLGL